MGALKLIYHPENKHASNLRVAYKSDYANQREPSTKDGQNLRLHYYVFGSIMPGRNFNASEYRYGFQNQEKDDEIFGSTGSFINYKYRGYDSRIGRFWSVDPLAAKYPHNSTYAFSENRVIDAIELEGLEAFLVHGMASNAGDWKSEEFIAVSKACLELTNNEEIKDGFDWSGYGNWVFQRQKHRTKAAKKLVEYIIEHRVEGEEVTLIGVSHGGNVAIQAAKILGEMGYKVNIITVNRSAHNDEGDVENPDGNEGINDFIDIRTKDDPVVPKDPSNRQGGGNNTYNGQGQKLIITNDVDGFGKHSTKNVDVNQIKNSSLRKLSPVGGSNTLPAFNMTKIKGREIYQ